MQPITTAPRNGRGGTIINQLKQRIMTHLEMKELLEAINVTLGGKQAEVEITDVIDLPEAQLYLFNCDDCEASAICYKDGTIFVLTDWQSGRPESYDEIEDFTWICANTGREALVLDGMPRIY